MTGTPITLTIEDADKLLDVLKHKYGSEKKRNQGSRNFCVALLMLDAGLRVGEVVKLTVHNLYFLNEPVYQLRVTEDIAKNHTERIIPLSERIRMAIRAMQVCVWSKESTYAEYFAFSHGTYRLPMTTRQVERIIRKAAMLSLGRPVHPHVLRHTFASRLMRTTNARVVQELLGHQHLSTTQIYMHPNEDDKKKAIESLNRNQPNNDVTES